MSSEGAESASILAKVQSVEEEVGDDREGDDHESRSNRYDHDEVFNQTSKKRICSTTLLLFDIVECILLRLPARSVARFRCVCKQWRSLTCDHRFIDDHCRMGALERCNLVSSCWIGKEGPSIFEAGKEFKRRSLKIELNGQESIPVFGYLSNPVNGLIAAFGISTSSDCEADIYLVNPTTRDHLLLPGGRWQAKSNGSMPELGLGFDASRGVYKLVRFQKLRDRDSRYGPYGACMVLTVGDGGWRCVEQPAPFKVQSRPVFLDGAVYWLAETFDPPLWSLLAFDVKEEKLRVMPMPITKFGDKLAIDYTYLRVLGGHVCIVKCSLERKPSPTWTRIWKLEGHPSHQHWKLKHEIEIDTYRSDCREKTECHTPLVIDIMGGKAIMQTFVATFSYHLRNKTFHKLFATDHPRLVFITESLVSPTTLVVDGN